jgi:hypothetical protein
MLEDGSAVASWVEFVNQGAQIRMRRIDRTGARSPAITVAGLADGRASGFPRVARHENELVFAWTESSGEGMQVVKTAVARLP